MQHQITLQGDEEPETLRQLADFLNRLADSVERQYYGHAHDKIVEMEPRDDQ